MPMIDNKYKKSSPEFKIMHNVNGWIREGVDHCEPKHRRSEDNNNMVRGEQWLQGDAERQASREKPALALNSLVKVVNAVANREIMDRIVPRVYGRNKEDNGFAQVLDSACNWQRDVSETEHEETMAFRNCVTSGYGVMHKWWDAAAMDGKGIVRDEEIPIWYMLWDSRARKQNLVDRKWHICGKYVPLDEVEQEFGDLNRQTKQMFRSVKDDAGFNIEPDGYVGPTGALGAGTWGQITSNRWVTSSRREIFLVEAEWQELEKFYKVAYPVKFDEFVAMATDPQGVMSLGEDPNTGQPIQITNEQYSQMEPEQQRQWMLSVLDETEVKHYDSLADFDPFVQQFEAIVGEDFEDYRREKRYVYKYAIVTNGTVLDHGDRPMGFTYEFLTGFPHETRESTDHFGMVDIAKAPQDFKNVFFSNLLTVYMTSPKQHLLIEEGSLNDVDRFLDEYAKVTGVSIVPNGFIGGNRFKELEKPSFPPMLAELIQLTEDSVEKSLGLSSIESNSQDDLRRVSGNVVQAAKQASNTLLAILFDALRRYRRRWGMLNIKFITLCYSPQDFNNIIGEELVPYIKDMTDWPNLSFDIKIDESPTSVTEQMETIDFLTRTGTLDNWKNSGDLEFEDIMDLMVQIPQSTRDKILQRREERGVKQQELQQLQQQMQQAQQQYENLLKFVQSNQGGAAIVAQYNLVEGLAQQKADEMAAQQEQQTQQMPQQGEVNG